ncbi:hypothetical protein Gotur_009230 [Gossypium turneri]
MGFRSALLSFSLTLMGFPFSSYELLFNPYGFLFSTYVLLCSLRASKYDVLISGRYIHDQLDASKEKQKAFSLAQQSCGSESHHWWKTPIDQLNPRELHERDKCFTEFINLISVARDKKVASISSMHTTMDDDVLLSFLLDMALVCSSFLPQSQQCQMLFLLFYFLC